VTDSNDLSSLADAINNRSAATGVSAELTNNGASIELVHETGDDISVLDATGPAASGTAQFEVNTVGVGDVAGALDSIVVGGEVSFSSSKAFSFASADTDFVAGGGASSALASVSDVSVASQVDAADAIAVVDGALEFVNSLRADLGAVQSRFESTIANLSTTAENLSAARSRIQDADFAAETAALTRAQILQQAGTSVLAQANQTPQNVLALLQ
jgi:flagellin